MQSLIIARKEILDHARDIRSLISSLFYALMGPLVVLMVSLGTTKSDKGGSMLLAMMSVFALVATFVGGMNVAMDSIAGERERRSLLPLLLNPIERVHVILGKWLGIAFFAACGLLVNLAGFRVVLAAAKLPVPDLLVPIACGLIPLALLAAALELLISTFCRNVKEAHTYLSLLVFAPMGLGMFLVFFPQMTQGWWFLWPIAGQQSMLMLSLQGAHIAPGGAAALGLITIASAALALLAATSLLHRDEVVYGG